jgi:hypothetical protein
MPVAETMFRALEQLYALGALNDKGELTTMGMWSWLRLLLARKTKVSRRRLCEEGEKTGDRGFRLWVAAA